MKALTCAQARPHLVRALQSEQPAALAPDVRVHLAECVTCRTALLLMNTLALTAAPEPIDCARCQADLPAFVERERDDGPLAAQHAYPHVWWHVWTCVDCNETYDTLRALVAAQQRGEL